eukprot:6396680-Prymnesium_polylepis.1
MRAHARGLAPDAPRVRAHAVRAMQRYISTIVRPSVLFDYRGTAPDACAPTPSARAARPRTTMCSIAPYRAFSARADGAAQWPIVPHMTMTRIPRTAAAPSFALRSYSAFLDELIHLSRTKLPRLDPGGK